MTERFNKYSLFILFLVGIIFIAGCRTLRSPEKSSSEWEAPKWEVKELSKDPVWESIKDQEVDTSKPLALSDLISLALEHNPSTREAWENTKVADAQRHQAQSKWYPQVTSSGNITYDRKYSKVELYEKNLVSYGPKSELTFLILDLGGRTGGVEEAAQRLLAANFQFNQAIQDLMLDVETSFYGYHSAASNLEAAKSNAADADAVFKAASHKFQVGLVSKLDVLQAESNYDDTLYNLADARGKLQAAKAKLAGVIGLKADTTIIVAPIDAEVPTEINTEDVSTLIEKALATRPDIAAERSILKSKKAAVKVANSKLWPTINGGGSAEAGWYKFYNANNTGKNDQEYMGYLSIKWDIFDGFKNLNEKRAAQREKDAELEKLRNLEIEASKDVWTKYHDYNTRVQKYKYSEAFLKSSETSHELAMDGYKEGLKSILDLLQAQSDLATARSRLVESRKDLFIALASLAHATGTLNIPEENQ